MIVERNDIDYSWENDQETAQQFEPFDIVLVDIHQTLSKRVIHSVKKRLEPGADLKYVAISYRWGELDENLIPTTDYDAHITSFRLADFVSLCEIISKECDLYLMQYVWVDAICVDQANETRRRETIYRMNEIYKYANWIIAVPDLHRAHLENSTANYNTLGWIGVYADYIYHLIMDNSNRVGELDDHWMENELKVPRDLRCYLSTTFTKLTPVLLSTELEECERMLFEKLMIPGDPKEMEQINPDGHLKSLEKKFRSLSSTMGLQNRGDQTQASHQLEIYQWQKNQLHEIYRLQRSIDQRHDMIKQILNFLSDLISDWSKRAWVISEYNIAMKKGNKVLKYWFISLNKCCSQNLESTFRFFEIDLKDKAKSMMNHGVYDAQRGQHYLITHENLFCGSEFRYKAHQSLNSTTFIEMLLHSKATKNSDRFHAILPLSKRYSRHRADRDTINSWKITDSISVRMRVRQWFTTGENLGLLVRYYTLSQDFGEVVSLPSFDSANIVYGSNYDYDADYHIPISMSGYQHNFDLDQDQPGLVMKDKVDGGMTDEDETPIIQLRYSMHLYPKVYFTKRIEFVQDVSSFIRDSIWQNLQLDPSIDQLTWARIPLFSPPNFEQEGFAVQENICVTVLKENMDNNIFDIIGSCTKNVWIIINSTSRLLKGHYIRSLDEWTWCQRDTNDSGLRVY